MTRIQVTIPDIRHDVRRMSRIEANLRLILERIELVFARHRHRKRMHRVLHPDRARGVRALPATYYRIGIRACQHDATPIYSTTLSSNLPDPTPTYCYAHHGLCTGRQCMIRFRIILLAIARRIPKGKLP